MHDALEASPASAFDNSFHFPCNFCAQSQFNAQDSQPMSGLGDRIGCGSGRGRDRDPEKCYQTLTHPMPHGLSMSRTMQAKHRSPLSESAKARKDDQVSRIKM